jgi:hypothetical protein
MDQIITEFLYHRGIHGFLNLKKEKGLAIPTTQAEMRKMISEERPQFITDIQTHMYKCIKKMLGYRSRYMKQEEEKRQKKAQESRVGTNKFKYKKN